MWSFSGKTPLCLIFRKSRKSLLSTAADIVKRLSHEATPETFLELLDAAFGNIEDGEELYAQFMNTLQDPGEKASTYLCHLQAARILLLREEELLTYQADSQAEYQLCSQMSQNTTLSLQPKVWLLSSVQSRPFYHTDRA